MAQIAISVPSVTINNQTIGIVPNTLTYTEGFGDQSVVTQSGGNGSIETVYYDNAENKRTMVSFELRNTAENIALARGWKTNLNQNTITVSDNNADFQRTVRNAALTNDYEVNLQSDGTISLEFYGDQTV
jgi:hypothetical protein